jgi:uncharacterized metal-binding protein YceD (DUF177 family)
MHAGKEYIIQFVGLAIGEHEFEFNVGNKFFENLDYSEIKQGAIKVKLTLIKQSTMMVLQFNVSGTVKMNCDRCSVEFDMPISGDYKLIVKVGGHEVGDEDDDIISIAANEHELDLSQFIYEYIMLSLPLKRVHPDDKNGKSTCDKEMLKKLKNYTIENTVDEPIDPRWDGLKNIKLN